MARMLARALVRRCPRCGSGGIFDGWFRMVERCPGCGHCFERRADEGFFLGAYTVNLVMTLAALLAVMVGVIAIRAADPSAGLVPLTAGAVAVAVVLPVLGYPLSKTTWAAIDLAMHPLEPDEAEEAARHVRALEHDTAGAQK